MTLWVPKSAHLMRQLIFVYQAAEAVASYNPVKLRRGGLGKRSSPFADGKALGALQTVAGVVRPAQGRGEPQLVSGRLPRRGWPGRRLLLHFVPIRAARDAGARPADPRRAAGLLQSQRRRRAVRRGARRAPPPLSVAYRAPSACSPCPGTTIKKLAGRESARPETTGRCRCSIRRSGWPRKSINSLRR